MCYFVLFYIAQNGAPSISPRVRHTLRRAGLDATDDGGDSAHYRGDFLLFSHGFACATANEIDVHGGVWQALRTTNGLPLACESTKPTSTPPTHAHVPQPCSILSTRGSSSCTRPRTRRLPRRLLTRSGHPAPTDCVFTVLVTACVPWPAGEHAERFSCLTRLTQGEIQYTAVLSTAVVHDI